MTKVLAAEDQIVASLKRQIEMRRGERGRYSHFMEVDLLSMELALDLLAAKNRPIKRLTKQ